MASSTNSCWKNENFKEQQRPFRSHGEWQEIKSEWESLREISFNPLSLIKAYNVAKAEYKKADRLAGGDKVAHCYIGCRIRQETDFETARFAAWYKEMRDLTDCNRQSHFEVADYEVTVFGAQLNATSSKQCIQYCSETLMSANQVPRIFVGK